MTMFLDFGLGFALGLLNIAIGLGLGFVFWPWFLKTRLGLRLTKRYRAPALPTQKFSVPEMRAEAIKALGTGARYEESTNGQIVGLLASHPDYQAIYSRVPRLAVGRARQMMVARLRDPDFVSRAKK